MYLVRAFHVSGRRAHHDTNLWLFPAQAQQYGVLPALSPLWRLQRLATPGGLRNSRLACFCGTDLPVIDASNKILMLEAQQRTYSAGLWRQQLRARLGLVGVTSKLLTMYCHGPVNGARVLCTEAITCPYRRNGVGCSTFGAASTTTR